jgi:uncharacterized protein HemX
MRDSSASRAAGAASDRRLWILAVVAVVALGAAVVNVFLQQGNASLQHEVNERQKVVNDGIRLAQLNAQLVQALVNVAAQTDDKAIRELLAGQGITFTVNRPQQGADSGK